MNFNLTLQEIALVGKALGMLPYVEVAGLISKLNTQITEQQKEQSEADPT